MAEQPQVKQQHPVPQEVFGVQFKLIGDLTARQFGILAICGFLAYIFFISNLFIIFRLLISGFFLLAGLGFAFVPVQDQSLDKWLVAFFRAIYTPTRRVWVKSAEPPEFLVLEIPQIRQKIEPGVTVEESRRRLKTFVEAVREETISPLDLEEKQHLKEINVLAREITTPPAPTPAVTVRPPEGEPVPSGARPSRPIPTAPPKPEEEIAPPPPTPPELRFIEIQKAKKPSLASKINWAAGNIYKVQRGEETSYFAARRNVRVGRRLTPLAISGEVVYTPVREQIIEPELPQVPPPPEVPALPVARPTTPPPLKPEPVPPPKVKPVEEPKAPPPAPKPKPVAPPKAPPAPPVPPKPTPIEEPKAPPPAPKGPEPLKIKKLPKPKLKIKPTAKLTEQPNTISGTVYDSKDGLLDQTLITIKDEKNNVIRATRTNELGKFSVASLPNGTYTLDIPKAPVPFATIKLELTGEKLGEMEIRPKK